VIGVALLSGGLDSGVAAACFAAEPENQLRAAVFCDYGQRARDREFAAAQALAKRFAVELHRYELPWLADLSRTSGSRLVAGAGDLPTATAQAPGDEASAKAVWVPARNAVFVSIAAAAAEALRADCVVTGFNREEAATFPDNSQAFLTAASAFLQLGTRSGMEVVSPTIAWDKDEIVAVAQRLGFSQDDFWSCYEGSAVPCRQCESCVRSRWQR
jgi:7-cyano-7-deazaguanine synthase